jgi:transcription antitermination factor NusG
MIKEKTYENSDENPVWFAMSATFGRAMKAKAFLESKSIECFVPMKYEVVLDKKQKKQRRLVPAINNLIFTHTTKQQIQSLKATIGYLQYLTKPENGKNVPIIVPEDQMEQFITVCNTRNDKLVYLTPDEIDLKEGTPVKIIGGALMGINGIYTKIKGIRNKRLIITIPYTLAITVEIDANMVEFLQQ